MNDAPALKAQAECDLDALYVAVKDIAEYHLKYLMACKGLSFCKQRYDEILHDASSLFIEENYLTKYNKIEYFYPMVMYAVKTSLWGRKRGVWSHNRKFEMNSVQMDEYHEHIPTLELETTDIKDYFLDILLLHEDSNSVLYVLYKEKYWKQAVLKIEKITGRKWIYDNVEKLHRVYEVLHVKK